MKTYHARLNVVVKHFKQLNTGRFANKKNSDTVRTLMKHDKSATHGAPRCKRKAPVQHNGEKPTKKAKKDPNMPKRGLSSYIFFMQDRRKSIVAKDESLTLAEISKELGRLWKEATADDKLKYEDLAKADKERYTKEMESYIAPPATNENGEEQKNGRSKSTTAKSTTAKKRRKKKTTSHPQTAVETDENTNTCN